MINIMNGLTFDDVLLIPKFSIIKSRKDIDLSVQVGSNLNKLNFKLDIPIVSANMLNVTEVEMANALSKMGGLPILHRFCTIQENVEMFEKCEYKEKTACSLGVNESEMDRANSLYKAGCRIFCVDVAHGHHENCNSMVEWLTETFDDSIIIAGNVATGLGAVALAYAGADVIKVGVGSGSICSTRINTGNGMPQLTALSMVRSALDVFKAKEGWKPEIIADGGLRNGGDVTKALCFADMVMLGSVLAGTNEAPGKVVKIDGVLVKTYEGSSTHKTSYIEGIKAHVPLKGPVETVITNLLEGVRSGLSYQGVNNLQALKKSPQFVKISNAGLTESKPHTVIQG